MPQLQVMGGELRGRRLHAPRDVRPTTGRVREAVFSILGDVGGARALDLFCGSGALGIEALSRGASAVTLVDTDPSEAARNVEDLEIGDRATVVRSDAGRFLEGTQPGSFDLVLCDPPYRLADRFGPELDAALRAALAPGGRVVVESGADGPLQLSLSLATQRRYGDTMVSVYSSDDTQ